MSRIRYFIVSYSCPKGEISARWFGNRVFSVNYSGTKSNLNRYLRRLRSLYFNVEFQEVGNSNYDQTLLDFDE